MRFVSAITVVKFVMLGSTIVGEVGGTTPTSPGEVGGVSKLVSFTTTNPTKVSNLTTSSMAVDVDSDPVRLDAIITFVCTEIVLEIVLRRGSCSTIDQIPTLERVTMNADATADMYISRLTMVKSVKFIRSNKENGNGMSGGTVLLV